MSRSHVLAFCTAIALLQGAAVAHACGDKLSVIGGGVSFDRVSQHRGNVVMLVEPSSALRAANDEFELRKALEFAGNKVRTVESPAELASVLDQGVTDVVLVSWGEAAKLQEQLSNRPGSPAVLPVAYRTNPTELAAASKQGTCYARAEQHQERQLVRTVGRVLEQREKNQPLNCRTVVASTST